MPYRSLPVGSKSLTDRAQHSPNPRPRWGRTPGDQAAAPRPPDPVSITRGLNRHCRHSRPVGAQTRSRCLSLFDRSARATAASCASELPPRTEAVWDRATRTASCLDRVGSAGASRAVASARLVRRLGRPPVRADTQQPGEPLRWSLHADVRNPHLLLRAQPKRFRAADEPKGDAQALVRLVGWS